METCCKQLYRELRNRARLLRASISRVAGSGIRGRKSWHESRTRGAGWSVWMSIGVGWGGEGGAVSGEYGGGEDVA